MLSEPSWWTARRLAGVLGILAVVALLALAWVGMLRRRVGQQTQIIGEKALREAVLEERNRIAREFHDSLEQELAGITIQLDTAADQLLTAPEFAARSLDIARQLSRRSLTEARRSVWDLRSRLLEEGDLATALREITRPIPGQKTIQVQVSTSGESRRLPRILENTVLRIGQEAVTNAVKHGRPNRIQIRLRYEPEMLRLEVHDDGCGFEKPPESAAAMGHFGLLGMQERTKKMGGVLLVKSTQGNGTVIALDLPTNGSNHTLAKMDN